MTKVAPLITKQDTHLRKAIPADEKLAITLRFLATGESYKSLQYQYRVSDSTIASFIKPVCSAIYTCLKDEYLKMPTSQQEWLQISNRTFERWQFPNAFAAADGKHIQLIQPAKSGAEFYNYKGTFSIVLLALADYDYRFLYCDVGCQGRISDGGVFRNSEFYSSLQNGKLNLPNPQKLPLLCDGWEEPSTPMPFVFIADDAFSLTPYCMKPFPQAGLTEEERIFNSRASRFRRIIENTFGIWVNRFRVFYSRMCLTPEKAIYITLASIALHNMLRTKSRESYTPPGFIDEVSINGEMTEGEWRNYTVPANIQPLPSTYARRATSEAIKIRNLFKEYFMGPGSVPWQWNIL